MAGGAAYKSFLWVTIALLILLGSGNAFNPLTTRRPVSSAIFPRLRSFNGDKPRTIFGWVSLPQVVLNIFKIRRRSHGSRRYARAIGTSTISRAVTNNPTYSASVVDAYTGPNEENLEVMVTIRYTGGVGYKPLYTGVCKVIKENFPGVPIRKMIIAPSGGSIKKQGMFEISIDDHVFYSKNRDSPGVYLSMKDLEDALEHRRREKAKSGVTWNKLLDALEDNDS